MANKITKRMVIEAMLSEELVQSNEMYRNFLAHEIELLDKKKSSKKPTKVQLANEPIKDEIIRVLGNASEGLTVTEVIQNGNFAEGTSNQKISSLMRQLVEANKVVRTEGKKTLFSLVVDEVDSPNQYLDREVTI